MSCENCNTIENLIAKFKRNEINTIELLQQTQELYGYLSEETITTLAEGTNIPVSELYGVVTFYAQFRLTPRAKYNIEVCTGTACYVNGADAIVERVKEVTKVKENGLSEDGKFCLSTARCLGCCGMAPLMCINGEMYGNLKEKDVDDIIAKLN